jgi:hypothetical protein
MSEQTEPGNEGIAERAKTIVDGAREKGGNLLDAVRSETGNAQATLADRLEASAETIREALGADRAAERAPRVRRPRSPGAQRRTVEASVAVANRMDDTAMWLRENDLSDLGSLLRRELRDRPGRVALIALGVGILIGGASRPR